LVDVIAAQQRAWNEGDLEGFLANYEEGFDVVLAGAHGVTRGWTEILEHYRSSFAGPRSMGRLTLTPRRVDLLGPEHARVTGEWSVLRDPRTTEKGVFTRILERREKRWVIIHDHTSTVLDPH
jgi:uncharacterized protein (TIGR02246 family)